MACGQPAKFDTALFFAIKLKICIQEKFQNEIKSTCKFGLKRKWICIVIQKSLTTNIWLLLLTTQYPFQPKIMRNMNLKDENAPYTIQISSLKYDIYPLF